MMSNQRERGISEFYHVQVTPGSYVIQNESNLITYKCVQKISANTVSLLNFSIINAFQNINEYYNQITVKIGNQIYYVQIPQASYSFWDINNMITLLQTQLNAQIAGSAFVIVLQGNNNKFVQITNNQPFQFIYSYAINQNQITTYLGFGNGSNVAFNQQQLTQTALFPYNVQVTSSINLQIQNLSMNTEVPGVVAQIPLNAGILGQIQYQSSYYQQNRHIITKGGNVAIQNLVIALLDDQGFKLTILDNRLAMTLLFEKFSAD